MSVKYQHPQYVAMAPKWKRCRDAAAGQDAVHAAGTEYLPRLSDQNDDDYKAYVMRTPFFNATWRTLEGMKGMLFRKPPTITVPATAEPLMDDVTRAGVPLVVFAQNVAEEALTVGRVGIFVDYPVTDPNATRADVIAQKLQPSMAMYVAESIINWRMRKVDNEYRLTLLVLVEEHADAKDEYEDVIEVRYRVLDLENVTGDYRVREFRIVKDKDGNERDEQIGVDQYPMLGGSTLKRIPFWVLGVDDLSPDCDAPPLIDVVDMNLSHYRTSADYEHGCHFTGCPTPVVSGYTPVDGANGAPPEKLYIGSRTAWVFPDPGATATYLEFTGQGLSALEKNLERKEGQMAILGARLLEVQKRAAEAAETAGIHRAGENSVLSSMSQTLSLGMKRALALFCQWADAAGEVVFDLNRDFFPVPMDPANLLALTNALQTGSISFETYFAQLQAGEVVSATRTADEEKAAIAANPPAAKTEPAATV